MKPLIPVAQGARVALGVSFFVVFVALWSVATFGGFVSRTFLADPLTMVRSGWTLLTQMGFGWDIGWTVWRVLGGFVIAAAIALPLVFIPVVFASFYANALDVFGAIQADEPL
mgnify:CR=1 FL=1